MNEALADPDQRSLVLFLEAGDKLAPDACFRIADTVETDPLIDLVYWDDDRRRRAGRRADPRFRPSWSPEMLLGANYLGRSFAIRRRLAVGIAGLRRAGSATTPGGTCSCAPTSTASGSRRVPRVLDAPPPPARRRSVAHGADVVAAHLERIGAARDAHRRRAARVRVEWELAEWPHVTVDHPDPPQPRAAHPRRSRPRRDRLPVASTSSSSTTAAAPTSERVVRGARSPTSTSRSSGGTTPFNYSAVNNAAAREARGEVLVFLNDDTELPDPGVAARDGRLGDCSPTSASSGCSSSTRDGDDPARRRDPRAQRVRRPPLRGHGARTRRR